MLKQRQQVRYAERGDTLIEVLFAITVFAMVMVGSLSIMNQGTIAAQRSVEITQVRQQVDAQAEAIRFIHSAYVAAYTPGTTLPSNGTPAAQWNALLAKASPTPASQYGSATTATTCTVPTPSRSFFMNPRTATVVSVDSSNFKSPDAAAQINYPSSTSAQSDGIWIEAVQTAPNGAVNGFIDFHIRACWSDPGMSRLMNIGTIVRLYEPR